MNQIEKLIAAIRGSFPGSVVVYTRGGCFEFYKILKAAFPDAEPFYDHREGHVYTRIGGNFYDINGKLLRNRERLVPMAEDRRLVGNAHRWMPNSNFRVVRMLDD